MCDEVHHVVLFVAADGFEEQTVHLDLIPTAHIPHKEPTDPDSDELNPVVVTDVTDDHGMVM